jgi:hypothetical protein
MTKEELEFVVAMAERHGREVEAVRQDSRNVETVAAAAREELNETELEVERLADNVDRLSNKVMRLNEALAQKERAIIARDAAVTAMAGECERLTDELAEANARPAGLVWHRAKNADGTPNLPGPDVVHIATIGIHVGYMSAWSRFNGEPSWVGPDGAGWATCIEWWAEVNMPAEMNDGGAA